MPGLGECPKWCSEDVSGPDGVLHRVVLGDVRLTRTHESTVCEVRRRPARSLDEQARLRASLATAASLLRLEGRQRRRIVFRGNSAVPPPEFAPTVAGRHGAGVAV